MTTAISNKQLRYSAPLSGPPPRNNNDATSAKPKTHTSNAPYSSRAFTEDARSKYAFTLGCRPITKRSSANESLGEVNDSSSASTFPVRRRSGLGTVRPSMRSGSIDERALGTPFHPTSWPLTKTRASPPMLGTISSRSSSRVGKSKCLRTQP